MPFQGTEKEHWEKWVKYIVNKNIENSRRSSYHLQLIDKSNSSAVASQAFYATFFLFESYGFYHINKGIFELPLQAVHLRLELKKSSFFWSYSYFISTRCLKFSSIWFFFLRKLGTTFRNGIKITLRKKKFFLTLGEDELLAVAVQKYPCLYDKSHRSHKEKIIVQNIWEAVAHKLDLVEDGENFFCYCRRFYWLYILPISPKCSFSWNGSSLLTLLTFAIVC